MTSTDKMVMDTVKRLYPNTYIDYNHNVHIQIYGLVNPDHFDFKNGMGIEFFKNSVSIKTVYLRYLYGKGMSKEVLYNLNDIRKRIESIEYENRLLILGIKHNSELKTLPRLIENLKQFSITKKIISKYINERLSK